jgi:hypothetical protein
VGALWFCLGETGVVGLLAKEKKQRVGGEEKKRSNETDFLKKRWALTFTQILVDEPIFWALTFTQILVDEPIFYP